MISKAGIAIFVFGNKLVNGQTVESNGMEEEFEICLKHQVIPIPIGATGYISKKLWDKVTADVKLYYPEIYDLTVAIGALGQPSLSIADIIKNVLIAVSILQKS
jgi:hypothetical protein